MFSIFDSLVSKFITKLVQHEMSDRTQDEQDSKKQEFFGMWKSCVDSANVTVSWSDGEPEPVFSGPADKPKKTAAKKTKAKSDDEEEVVGKCVYVATKGNSKGKVCGKKAVAGKKMCASHKKAEEEEESVLSEEKVVDSEDDTTTSESTGDTPAAKTCVYTPSRGKSKGDACGCAVVDGTDLCSKHSKKTKSKSTTEAPADTDAEPKEAKTETKVHVVKKQNGRWVHVESGFVFKSNKERVVVGKMVDNVCEPITDDDLPELARYSFEHEVSTN